MGATRWGVVTVFWSLVASLGLVAAFWAGRRSTRGAGESSALAALWAYQQLLNDRGHEIDTLVASGDSTLSDVSRDDITVARRAAYPHATLLRPEARELVLRPTLPTLIDTDFDLVDLAHAYLTLAERLSDEILRAQFPARRRAPFVRLDRPVGAPSSNL